jgi:uncharacterized glyoxalase superfamily metalloenzyme YdcJ
MFEKSIGLTFKISVPAYLISLRNASTYTGQDQQEKIWEKAIACFLWHDTDLTENEEIRERNKQTHREEGDLINLEV